jgi:AcrR family transcriptional regulator
MLQYILKSAGQRREFVRFLPPVEADVTDRRIKKTREHLRRALVSLVREKDYDTIAVKQILHRANVGRTTFYAHFSDKDELLVSSIQEILGAERATRARLAARGHERLIWFSLPLLEYRDQHRHADGPRMGVRTRTAVHEHLRVVLAELVAAELKALRGTLGAIGNVPPDLLGQHVASTFVRVMDWWVESKSPLRAKEVDGLFRALIAPSLGG